MANRIGEIHQATDPGNWFWIEGSLNIADITTRGLHASLLGRESEWKKGPAFLRDEESEWPIYKESLITEFPEEKKKFIGLTKAEENTSLTAAINIERFSKIKVLIMTTARILKLYKRFKTGGKKEDTEITPAEIKEAEKTWIIDAQKELISENGKGKLKKLSPELQEGILVVGGRAERWMEATYNNQKFILLPQSHKLSYLIALHEHKAI